MKPTDEIENLLPCPFCGEYLVQIMRKANPMASCKTEGCIARKLLEQALTALVQCTYDEEGYLLNPDNEAAIEAIRAELAKPEQELLDAGTGGFGSTGGAA